MRNKDAVFTTNYVEIKVPTITSSFQIIPFGDEHYASPQHDEDRFDDFCQYGVREKTPTYYLGIGDNYELCSSSERKGLDNANLHESSTERFNDMVIDDHIQLRDKLKFMRGRMLGMIQGNHYWVFNDDNEAHGILKGQTTDSWLAEQLGCKWLGWLSYIRVKVIADVNKRNYNVDIVACHGKAGGKLLGTSINQVTDLKQIFPLADIYIMGHNHSRGAWPDSALYISPNNQQFAQHGEMNVKQKRQYFVRSGSFLKGYVDGKESYIVKRLLRPAELGIVRIEIKANRITHRKKDINGGKYQQDLLLPDIHVWS